MSDTKHTDLPWSERNVGYGSFIRPEIAWIGFGTVRTIAEHRANAAFIVRACNAHYEMLDALKKAYYDMHIPELAQKTIEAAVIEATGGMP